MNCPHLCVWICEILVAKPVGELLPMFATLQIFQNKLLHRLCACVPALKRLWIPSLCSSAHPEQPAAVAVRLPTARKNLGTFRSSTVSAERYLTRVGEGFLIKLMPKPRLWETVHLLCKVARNSPSAKTFHLASIEGGGLGECRYFFFYIYNPSHHHHHNPFFSYLIHISWRALEVWNCLKLIHYWIFSRRLKSLAPLPHNSAPIDCLGPNISQGCTEFFFFFRGDSLAIVLAQLVLCWGHANGANRSICQALRWLSSVHGLFRLGFMELRHFKLVVARAALKPHLQFKVRP